MPQKPARAELPGQQESHIEFAARRVFKELNRGSGVLLRRPRSEAEYLAEIRARLLEGFGEDELVAIVKRRLAAFDPNAGFTKRFFLPRELFGRLKDTEVQKSLPKVIESVCKRMIADVEQDDFDGRENELRARSIVALAEFALERADDERARGPSDKQLFRAIVDMGGWISDLGCRPGRDVHEGIREILAAAGRLDPSVDQHVPWKSRRREEDDTDSAGGATS